MNKVMKRWGISLIIFIIFAILIVKPAFAAAAISVRVGVGYDGNVKTGRGVPLTITLSVMGLSSFYHN